MFELCCEVVDCRTSSVRCPSETRRKKNFEDEADGIESIKKAVAQYENQTTVFTTV